MNLTNFACIWLPNWPDWPIWPSLQLSFAASWSKYKRRSWSMPWACAATSSKAARRHSILPRQLALEPWVGHKNSCQPHQDQVPSFWKTVGFQCSIYLCLPVLGHLILIIFVKFKSRHQNGESSCTCFSFKGTARHINLKSAPFDCRILYCDARMCDPTGETQKSPRSLCIGIIASHSLNLWNFRRLMKEVLWV